MVRNDWCDTGAELFLHFVFSNADPTLSITFHIVSVQMINEGRTTMGIGMWLINRTPVFRHLALGINKTCT